MAAVADPREQARANAQQAFPSALLVSSAEELSELPLQAMLVASPPSAHWDAWLVARDRRLPVFMEKPFPLPVNLAELEALSGSRVPLMVDFNRRFWPLYRELGRQCRNGSIGESRWAKFQLHVNVRRWSSGTDHRSSETEGGALQDLGAQMVDLALATFEREVDGAEIETDREQQSLIRMRLAGGLNVECDVAYAARTREQVEIWGSGGKLRIVEPNMGLRREPYASPLQGLATVARDGWLLAGHVLRPDNSLLRHSVRMALNHFFQAVRNQGSFEPGIDVALKTARVLAMAEQPQSGSEVCG